MAEPQIVNSTGNTRSVTIVSESHHSSWKLPTNSDGPTYITEIDADSDVYLELESTTFNSYHLHRTQLSKFPRNALPLYISEDDMIELRIIQTLPVKRVHITLKMVSDVWMVGPIGKSDTSMYYDKR